MTNKKNIRSHRGFTLLELLVVVLIIGILAAVALPQYQIAVLKSRYATLITMVQPIKLSAERYYLAQGVYPPNWAAMDINPPAMYGETYFNSDSFLSKNQYMFDLYDSVNKNIVGYVGTRTDGTPLAYVMWLDHSPIKASAIECWADPTNNAAIKVCEANGGVRQGSAGGGFVPYWNRYVIRAPLN